jgi:hypothetical protein
MGEVSDLNSKLSFYWKTRAPQKNYSKQLISQPNDNFGPYPFRLFLVYAPPAKELMFFSQYNFVLVASRFRYLYSWSPIRFSDCHERILETLQDWSRNWLSPFCVIRLFNTFLY